MIKVYIASPYTNGKKDENVYRQIDMADILLDEGFAPFVPLLMHFHDAVYPKEYDVWLNYDLDWLAKCDCLLRLDGKSEGADKEVKRAKELGIPVFYYLEDLLDAYK